MTFSSKVRQPAVAGQFYEGDPARLHSVIESMKENALKSANGQKTGSVRAVILPHAGYVYSGQTATTTISVAREKTYKRILVIAPTHQVPMQGLATADYSDYRTPLGNIPVDREAVDKISSCDCPFIQELNEAHADEHSLEVELPLLQSFFNDFKLIPLICGSINIEMANALADTLIDFWNEDTLWVISSDFTHYGHSFNYVPFAKDIPENLSKLDHGAADKILSLDFKGFDEYINSTGATVCGANPIRILLAVLDKIKGKETVKAELAAYATSGEMSGDYSHCVSYAGIVFCDK